MTKLQHFSQTQLPPLFIIIIFKAKYICNLTKQFKLLVDVVVAQQKKTKYNLDTRIVFFYKKKVLSYKI